MIDPKVIRCQSFNIFKIFLINCDLNNKYYLQKQIPIVTNATEEQ